MLVSYAQPTCRPDSSGQAVRPARQLRPHGARRRAAAARRLGGARERTGLTSNAPVHALALDGAGAAGILEITWSQRLGRGQDLRHARPSRRPSVDLSCEDYGLVYRLTAQQPGPGAPARRPTPRLQGEVPVFNIIAEIRGTEKPNEYVMLSAHFDSWDGGSGATDNGTGTVTMLEAMRILKQVYPNPQAHHPGRALERRGAGAQRLARLRGRPSRDRRRAAGAVQPGQRHRARDSEHFGAGADRTPRAVWRDWLSRVPTELTSEHQAGTSRPAGQRRHRQRLVHLLRRARPSAWVRSTGTTGPTPGTPTATPSTRSCSTSSRATRR